MYLYFDLFQGHPMLALALTFIVSLCIGSFLNVVIHRLPRMMEHEWQQQLADAQEQSFEQPAYNLSVPGSHCPGCDYKIRWYENIPLLSYLFLRGRCSQCKTSISLRYPLVELSTALICSAGIWHYGLNEIGIAFALFSCFLICLTLIDYDHQLLPDTLTLPLLWLGLLVNSYSVFTTLHLAVFGAAGGYMILWSIYHLFRLITGKEGMGYGDFKLLAALGAWVGGDKLPVLIFISAFIASVLGILMMALGRHNRGQPMPFGPFLAMAGWIALLWGDDVTQAYYQLLMGSY
ncbi:MAG: A24 family peptidase [Marinobacterium sp.]|nr:A24 family peptidase [Marinobacterium sp.]